MAVEQRTKMVESKLTVLLILNTNISKFDERQISAWCWYCKTTYLSIKEDYIIWENVIYFRKQADNLKEFEAKVSNETNWSSSWSIRKGGDFYLPIRQLNKPSRTLSSTPVVRSAKYYLGLVYNIRYIKTSLISMKIKV